MNWTSPLLPIAAFAGLALGGASYSAGMRAGRLDALRSMPAPAPPVVCPACPACPAIPVPPPAPPPMRGGSSVPMTGGARF